MGGETIKPLYPRPSLIHFILPLRDCQGHALRHFPPPGDGPSNTNESTFLACHPLGDLAVRSAGTDANSQTSTHPPVRSKPKEGNETNGERTAPGSHGLCMHIQLRLRSPRPLITFLRAHQAPLPIRQSLLWPSMVLQPSASRTTQFILSRTRTSQRPRVSSSELVQGRFLVNSDSTDVSHV
ncbi:hypothetical protein N7539_001957 [Penicillium diatomitis]|uniref:Uncharacterized protein n=1 Tax=Penicillium diatomitis TaxID=2819901 RepID=A0A9X0C0D8_9EURO|nr:uncharacterized protein N7539_001957 [Penicillium diatomitis]KAJ5493211.1 hypothetical protein N7539_001957 [Penicillium diatomitis]